MAMLEDAVDNVTPRRKPPDLGAAAEIPPAQLKLRNWWNTITRETKPVTIAMAAAKPNNLKYGSPFIHRERRFGEPRYGRGIVKAGDETKRRRLRHPVCQRNLHRRCLRGGGAAHPELLREIVMAGAAGQSILLAVAIAKVGDEAKMLTEYNGPSGRRKVTDRITGGLTASFVNQFTVALSVLHFWRDDASHGVMTTISEIEAHAILMQLSPSRSIHIGPLG
jgi:hypothetical protein